MKETAKKKKSPTDNVPVSVTISRSTRDKLAKVAEKSGKTISKLLAYQIEVYAGSPVAEMERLERSLLKAHERCESMQHDLKMYEKMLTNGQAAIDEADARYEAMKREFINVNTETVAMGAAKMMADAGALKT